MNDTLGQRSVTLFSRCGNRLREMTRDTDMVARLGGDEFAIVEGRLEQVEDAAVLAGRVVKVMRPSPSTWRTSIVIGASVGIAVAPLTGAMATF